MSHRLLCAVLGFALVSCAQEPSLFVSVDRRTIDGRVERAVLSARAADAFGQPGQGTVQLTAAVGAFVEGDQVPLVEGVATGTFQCDPRLDSACNGEVPISAEWTDLTGRVSVRVGPQVNAAPLRWRLMPTGALETLRDVAIASDGAPWAVGAGATALRFDGALWLRAVVPAETLGVEFNGVWAGDGAVFVVGDRGVFLEWDGQALVTAAPFPVAQDRPVEDFTAVWARAPDDAWLVTRQGGVYHFDGTALAEAHRVTTGLLAVGGRGDEVWAVGEGTAQRRAEGAWAEALMPMLGTWRAVGLDLDGVWIAGERSDGVSDNRGVCLVSSGGDFVASQVSSRPIVDVLVGGGEERFTLSGDDVFRRVLNGSWTSTAAPIGGAAMASRSSVDVFVVGPSGVVIRGTP